MPCLATPMIASRTRRAIVRIHGLDCHAEIIGDIGLRHTDRDGEPMRIGPRAAFRQREEKLRHFGLGFSLAEKRDLAACAEQFVVRYDRESAKKGGIAL